MDTSGKQLLEFRRLAGLTDPTGADAIGEWRFGDNLPGKPIKDIEAAKALKPTDPRAIHPVIRKKADAAKQAEVKDAPEKPAEKPVEKPAEPEQDPLDALRAKAGQWASQQKTRSKQDAKKGDKGNIFDNPKSKSDPEALARAKKFFGEEHRYHKWVTGLTAGTVQEATHPAAARAEMHAGVSAALKAIGPRKFKHDTRRKDLLVSKYNDIANAAKPKT